MQDRKPDRTRPDTGRAGCDSDGGRARGAATAGASSGWRCHWTVATMLTLASSAKSYRGIVLPAELIEHST